ncbi:MAG: hypothetical protein H6906_06905 [Hyphomicrobiales bacterium]|nr:hypothetical protein [Hyphomicrobiales bacterium]
MGLMPTLAVAAAAAAAFAAAWWGHRRPYEPGRPWRPPYLAIMWLSLLVVIMMLAHLVTLVTGTPLKSRWGY